MYDLYLHPDLATGKFTGNVKISLDITEISSEIIIHSNLLEITSVEFTKGGTVIPNVSLLQYKLIIEHLTIVL